MISVSRSRTSEKGPHALFGAELARETGENELVANAIGAHHGEEPMNSAYAWLVCCR